MQKLTSVCHVCLTGVYTDNFQYHENILPVVHQKMGLKVYRIINNRYYKNTEGEVGTREPADYTDKDGILNIMLRPSGSIPFLHLQTFEGLYENLAALRPDIIFVHGVQFINMLDVIKYKKKHPGVKLFADNHSDPSNTPADTLKRKLFYRYIYGTLARMASKYTEMFWGVTPSRVDYLHEVYKVKPGRTGLLVMGADDDDIDYARKSEIRHRMRESVGVKETDFLVVTGGKIDEWKNIHLLPDVFRRMKDPAVKLVIFGNPVENMKPYFTDIPANVKMVGWIPAAEAYNWFLAADLGFFPGRHSVLWEQAVASGLPSVFKYWKGMDHVDVGGNALFIGREEGETKDAFINEMEQAIRELAAKGEKYAQMEAVAGTKARETFLYSSIGYTSIGLKK